LIGKFLALSQRERKKKHEQTEHENGGIIVEIA
jgi:hypothetical protein